MMCCTCISVRLSEADYEAFISRHRGAFPIRRAEDMASACPRIVRRKLSSTSATQITEGANETGKLVEAPDSLSSESTADASGFVLPLAPRRESAVPVLAVAEQHGAEDAMDMIWEAHHERARELAEVAAELGTGPETAPPQESEIAASDDAGLENHADPMEVDIAVPSLAVLQQHGADEAQAMIQESFDERARELEADMLAARRSFEAALRARGGN